MQELLPLIVLLIITSIISKIRQRISQQNAMGKPANKANQVKAKQIQANAAQVKKPEISKTQAENEQKNKARAKNKLANKSLAAKPQDLSGKAERAEFGFASLKQPKKPEIIIMEEKPQSRAAACVKGLQANSLKTAVIMSEVLDKPVGLRETHLF